MFGLIIFINLNLILYTFSDGNVKEQMNKGNDLSQVIVLLARMFTLNADFGEKSILSW